MSGLSLFELKEKITVLSSEIAFVRGVTNQLNVFSKEVDDYCRSLDSKLASALLEYVGRKSKQVVDKTGEK